MLRPGHFFGRLLAAAVVVLAPLVALHGYTLYQQHQRAEALAYRSVTDRAAVQAKALQELFDRTRSLLEVIAARADVAGLDPARCTDVLRGLDTVDPLYANLGVVAADGTLVCSARDTGPELPPVSYAGRAGFAAALQSDEPLLRGPSVGPTLKTPVAVLTVPLRDATGQPIGVVGATLHLVKLAQQEFAPGLPEGGSLTLVRSDDTVLTRYPDPERWIGRATPRSVQSVRKVSPNGVVVVSGADQIVRAYATADVGVHGLRVAAGVPTEVVFAAPRAALTRSLAVAGLTLLLAAGLALVFGRMLSMPLESLGRTAKAWASGARGTRANERLPGEFRTLAQEFNAMIDAREASEARLVESERRYAAMLDGVDLLALTVSLDGRLMYANDALCRLTGWSHEELMAGDWTRLVLPADATDVFANLRGQADGEAPMPARQDGFVVTRAGHRRRIRWALAPLRSASGELLGITSIGEDVTERAEAEHARQASARAQAANQAKTAFLAHMSHELRTPLNAVLGFSQLLQLETGDRLAPNERHQLQLIHLAGIQLRSLIEDVLDVSQIESGRLSINLETVELARLVDEVVELSGPAAHAARVSLMLDGPSPAVLVRTDPVRLRQILLNLVSNGIKYNRAGGHVHLRLRATGPHLDVEVQDNGLGMSEQQLSQLFEPFNRLGREGSAVPGTGIGLTLSRQLARLLGGDITVESAPSHGTRMTLSLRDVLVGEARPLPGAPAALPPAPAGQPAGTVLYIEDNAANTLIVQELLAPWPGVKLLLAADGRTGIDLARTASPDLVLLDMRLPDLHGLEVLAALRTEPLTADIPVVSLSASAMPEEVDAARAAGATAYWTKPIDFGPFLQGVASLLARRRTPAPRA